MPEAAATLRDVLVVGTGMVPFARYPEKTLADLAWPAVLAALREAGFNQGDVDPRGFRSGAMNERLPAPERYR